MKDKARKDVIDYFKSKGAAAGDIGEKVDRFLDYVTIMPVDLDPSGIVQEDRAHRGHQRREGEGGDQEHDGRRRRGLSCRLRRTCSSWQAAST